MKTHTFSHPLLSDDGEKAPTVGWAVRKTRNRCGFLAPKNVLLSVFPCCSVMIFSTMRVARGVFVFVCFLQENTASIQSTMTTSHWMKLCVNYSQKCNHYALVTQERFCRPAGPAAEQGFAKGRRLWTLASARDALRTQQKFCTLWEKHHRINTRRRLSYVVARLQYFARARW